MITQHAYRGASATADRVLSPSATEPQASPPIRVTPAFAVNDYAPAEGLRQDYPYKLMMARGSHDLLAALNGVRGLPAPRWTPPSKPRPARAAQTKPRLPDYIVLPPRPRENPFRGLISVPQRLINSVAADFDISYGELIGDCRGVKFIDARAVVSKILNDRGYSLAHIGRILRRDHSSVINTLGKFDIYLRRNLTVGESYRKHTAWMREAAVELAAMEAAEPIDAA